MAAANFGVLARRWIYDVLINDPELKTLGLTGVGEHPGGSKAKHPFISYSTATPFLSSADVEAHTGHAEGNVLVRVNGNTGRFSDLELLSDRMIALLAEVNDAPIPGRDALVLTCRWHRAHEFADPAGGDYRSLGAVFRLAIQAT